MREIALVSGKFYTAGTNFTRLPVVTVATNLNCGRVMLGKHDPLTKIRQCNEKLAGLISMLEQNPPKKNLSEDFALTLKLWLIFRYTAQGKFVCLEIRVNFGRP